MPAGLFAVVHQIKSGNLQGISSLLKGMPVQEAIQRMEGIRCGMKSTSCPDQMAQALKQFL